MKAMRIKMKPGCHSSNNLCEIDSIYLDEVWDFIKKEKIHNYLLEHPGSIYVNIWPYPYLQPMVSRTGEKYVRSEADSTKADNLLNLPRY